MPHLSTIPKVSPLFLQLFNLPYLQLLLEVQESGILLPKLHQLLLSRVL